MLESALILFNMLNKSDRSVHSWITQESVALKSCNNSNSFQCRSSPVLCSTQCFKDFWKSIQIMYWVYCSSSSFKIIVFIITITVVLIFIYKMFITSSFLCVLWLNERVNVNVNVLWDQNTSQKWSDALMWLWDETLPISHCRSRYTGETAYCLE